MSMFRRNEYQEMLTEMSAYSASHRKNGLCFNSDCSCHRKYGTKVISNKYGGHKVIVDKDVDAKEYWAEETRKFNKMLKIKVKG